MTEEIPHQPTAVAPVEDPSFERRAVRRGCFSIIFGAMLGMLGGTALTLAILFGLNNSLLDFNSADVRLRHQLDAEIATRQAVLNQQKLIIDDVSTRQAAVDALFTTAEAQFDQFHNTAVAIETRMAAEENAADTLTSFLGGLDGLLADLAPTPTPTAVASPTPTN